MATDTARAYERGLREGRAAVEVRPANSTAAAAPAAADGHRPGWIDVPRISGCDDLERRVRERRDEMRRLNLKRRYTTDASIAQQFARLKVMYRQMFDKETMCDDFEWARDTRRVLAFIHDNPAWKTDYTRHAYRSALAAVLRNLLGFEKESAVYSAVVKTGRATLEQQVGENKLRGTAKDNYLPWSELVEAAAKAPAGSTDAAIMAIYTFIPPRRLLDYSIMRVVRGGDADTLDPSDNYLVVDGDNRPQTFIFNRYKTSASFGQQVIPVQRHLADVLHRYLRKHAIREGWLFPHRTGSPHTNFSRVVSDVFRRHTGKAVSVDLLRHAFVTMALDRRPTLNERAELARQMAHSVGTQAQYEILE